MRGPSEAEKVSSLNTNLGPVVCLVAQITLRRVGRNHLKAERVVLRADKHLSKRLGHAGAALAGILA